MRGIRTTGALLIVGVLVLVLLLLQQRLQFGDTGNAGVAQLRERVEQQQRQNEGLQQRNDALAAEVTDLKSGEAAIEERARNELGMIKPGETFYRVVDRERTDRPEPAPEVSVEAEQ